MNKKTLSPSPNQPIDRVPAGQLPSALAELTEAALAADNNTLPAGEEYGYYRAWCSSYDGEDE